MTIFYICRHGMTVTNRERRLSGWYDTPLTEEGVQNAEACARKLQVAGIEFDKVVSSDLGRAVATADIIVRGIGYSGDIERYDGLREVNYGDFANQPISVYPTLTPLENSDYVPPGGESLAQMAERIMACIHQIAVAEPDKTMLIVAHDGTINAIRATFNHQSIGEADTVRNPYDGVIKFEYENDSVVSFEVLD